MSKVKVQKVSDIRDLDDMPSEIREAILKEINGQSIPDALYVNMIVSAAGRQMQLNKLLPDDDNAIPSLAANMAMNFFDEGDKNEQDSEDNGRTRPGFIAHTDSAAIAAFMGLEMLLNYGTHGMNFANYVTMTEKILALQGHIDRESKLQKYKRLDIDNYDWALSSLIKYVIRKCPDLGLRSGSHDHLYMGMSFGMRTYLSERVYKLAEEIWLKDPNLSASEADKLINNRSNEIADECINNFCTEMGLDSKKDKNIMDQAKFRLHRSMVHSCLIKQGIKQYHKALSEIGKIYIARNEFIDSQLPGPDLMDLMGSACSLIMSGNAVPDYVLDNTFLTKMMRQVIGVRLDAEELGKCKSMIDRFDNDACLDWEEIVPSYSLKVRDRVKMGKYALSEIKIRATTGVNLSV